MRSLTLFTVTVTLAAISASAQTVNDRRENQQERSAQGVASGQSPATVLHAAQPPAKFVEFSAEMGQWEDGIFVWSKVYVGDAKVRVEGWSGGVGIWDMRNNTGYFGSAVGPIRLGEREARLFEFYLGGPLRDPASPCAQVSTWFGALSTRDGDDAAVRLGSCSQGPAALVNGRHTQLWKLKLTIGDEGVEETGGIIAWIDPLLKHCIRLEIEEEGKWRVARELRNIKVDRQPAALFEIPTGVKANN